MIENISVIIGTVVGGGIGFLSSYCLWKNQLNFEKKKIVRGFIVELKNIREFLKKIPLDHPYGEHNGIIDFLTMKEPLYGEDGLYFTFKKEIFLLDDREIDLMLSLYPKVLIIEKFRRELNSESLVSTDPFSLGKTVRSAISEIDELLGLLDKK